ncbi:MAG: transporter [FCB group bacterium]|nr:transporter [FCB group bacterium]
MKRNSTEAGALLTGIGYEYEYLEDAQFGDQPAPNPKYEKTSNSTAFLYINYGVTDKLSVEAILPWRSVVNNKILYENPSFIRRTSGIGDLILLGRYSYSFFDQALQVNVGIGAKLATGRLDKPDPSGKRISDNLQIGSGTIDPVFSIFASTSSLNSKWLITGNMISKISSGPNIYGYEYGNEYHYSLGLSYDRSDILFLQAKLDYIYTFRDTDEYGMRVKRERGGRWLYAVPGFGLRVHPELILDVEFPLSLYQYVNESQLVSPGYLRMNLTYTPEI